MQRVEQVIAKRQPQSLRLRFDCQALTGRQVLRPAVKDPMQVHVAETQCSRPAQASIKVAFSAIHQIPVSIPIFIAMHIHYDLTSRSALLSSL